MATDTSLPPARAAEPTPGALPEALANVISGTEHLALYRWGRRRDDNAATPPPPALLLVHGYPDSARVWHGVASRLARQGFHVWAYDVRGAGASSRPGRVHDYRLAHLMDDMLAVIDATGRERVHLVGHDWGAIQGWEAVAEARLCQRLHSFTSVSGLCLDHVGQLLAERFAQARDGTAGPDVFRATAGQLLRSWYVWALHAPVAPLAWGLGLGWLWPHLLARLERTAPLTGVDATPTRARDGAAGVALYRANVMARLRAPAPKAIDVPVRAIHPTGDPFIAADLLAHAGTWARRYSRRDVPGGHWLPLTDPDLLAGMVAEFVREVEAENAAAGDPDPGKSGKGGRRPAKVAA